ncbi:MAG: nickel pincer cofactor biosynthesis protein LarC [Planctomycetota bacterium]|jgi:uncharacterized protein (TIGR00299 family) protein
MKKISFFDCFSGVAGDMILGALVDAGLSLPALQEGMKALPLGGYSLQARKVKRGAISGTKVDVVIETKEAPFRDPAAMASCIAGSTLPGAVKERSLRVVDRLRRAEAAVHGMSNEPVHFHDLALIDTAVDVVGSVLGLDMLGVEEVHASPVSVGRGFLDCGHGRLPAPPPASVEILKGIPTVEVDVNGEIATPTGCALVAELAVSFGKRPPMVYDRIGYGAGEKKLEALPNLLRILLGATPTGVDTERTLILETNLDDLPSQILGPLFGTLLEKGALDVWASPVTMKKGRPGVILSVLTTEDLAPVLEDLLFLETTTLGVRRTSVDRTKLDRQVVNVETRYGEVRIKLGILPDGSLKAAPEFDDCLALARAQDVPVREIIDEARARARDLLPPPR